ncbi:CopY family transcriptional regulator [Carbonactinospora thermoautotrophica]|uniref:CopY family transcriptional regulator n=1 Tax=Carbonactinospora thermoautotrophica TaxID=1469144 RepID=A0A132MNH9_9ACTN|nr:BlaI/MecI/CopY family transcriptional regulator [Carbonactinospora thermoautotrophica]KWW99420.1 Transcriptional repressor [Carbonactinospora thermoautotrophica]KWX04141.1 CopY family transcriptional regulator [Carbonactinospora thermoautotrophica]KWX10101.1 CopY family transcriptional regulator [Carbonactinospora thermoautotrophica]
MKQLGDLERAVMEVLWNRAEPVTARDVTRALAGDRDLAYTTVMTVLDRLTRKGFATRERDGRAWRYRAAASREEYVAELMLGALAMTGDRDAALVHFAQSMTGREAAVLRRALGLDKEPHKESEP